MKKILITGASGLLSSKFIKLYHRNYDIFKIYRNKKNLEKNEYNIDLNDSKQLLKLINKIEKIDIVIHLSAQTLVWKSIQNPIEDINSNIVSTVNLLESFKSYGLEKFIFASTEAVYGELISPVETSEKVPVNPYGISKLTCENYISFYQTKYNLNCHIIRPSFIIDFNMSRNPLFDILNAFKNGSVTLFQSINSEFNFISSDKVASIIHRIINEEILIKELNIVNSTNTNLNEIVNYLQKEYSTFTVIDKPNKVKQTLNSIYPEIKDLNKENILDFCTQYINFHSLD